MKIMVLGSKGMLGKALIQACLEYGMRVAGYDLPEVDITKIDKQVKWVDWEDVEWVVNCAAYTAVDKAEEDSVNAFEVNAVGAGKVARVCSYIGVKMLHVSTDYVFDGKKGSAYVESDKTSPVNMYGLSKGMGEVLVSQELSSALIIRTQSLFGDGHNFVKSILRQIDEGKKELKVVEDQVSCPTYVGHLAKAMVLSMKTGVTGILHLSSSDECSWYRLAEAILEEKNIKDVCVKPVLTGEFPVKAIRPPFSVLSNDRFNELTGCEMPTWRVGLKEYLARTRG
jgi:dTDP-4-dehydrorhamnose reductase